MISYPGERKKIRFATNRRVKLLYNTLVAKIKLHIPTEMKQSWVSSVDFAQKLYTNLAGIHQPIVILYTV